jgi:hypothetical protein
MMAESEFSRWLNTYEDLYENPSDLLITPCPNCGVVGQLNLIFVVRGNDAETGLATFWCDACLVGLIPLRAPLPPDADIVTRGQEKVPNYRLVVPDPDDE